jgi:hypothetical protein
MNQPANAVVPPPNIDWGAIETFIGFGRPDAPVVFIGMEERLENPAHLPADLLIRSGWSSIMDLQDAHVNIPGAEAFLRIDGPITQRTWRPMCDLMLRRNTGGNTAPSLNQRLYYQANRLGRNDGETLLAELLPYPHPDAQVYWYANYGRFQDHDQYRNILLPIRLTLLSCMLASCRRSLIVCYGQGNWEHYKALIGQYCRRLNVATPPWEPGQDGNMEVCNVGEARILLVHHFATQAFNSDAQLGAFANVALGLNG